MPSDGWRALDIPTSGSVLAVGRWSGETYAVTIVSGQDEAVVLLSPNGSSPWRYLAQVPAFAVYGVDVVEDRLVLGGVDASYESPLLVAITRDGKVTPLGAPPVSSITGVASYRGRLYLAALARDQGALVLSTADGGRTWRTDHVVPARDTGPEVAGPSVPSRDAQPYIYDIRAVGSRLVVVGSARPRVRGWGLLLVSDDGVRFRQASAARSFSVVTSVSVTPHGTIAYGFDVDESDSELSTGVAAAMTSAGEFELVRVPPAPVVVSAAQLSRSTSAVLVFSSTEGGMRLIVSRDGGRTWGPVKTRPTNEKEAAQFFIVGDELVLSHQYSSTLRAIETKLL